MEENEALLVIDVDLGDGWEHEIGKPSDIEWEKERQSVASHIVETLKDWRRAGKMVFFIVLVPEKELKKTRLAQLTDDDRSQCVACHSLPAEFRLAKFLGHRHGENFEPVFLKDDSNAFTNSVLVNSLRAWGISKIFLVGCQTFVCVLDTARGAVKNGIKVTLLKDCVYPAFESDEKEKDWLKYATSFVQVPSVSIK